MVPIPLAGVVKTFHQTFFLASRVVVDMLLESQLTGWSWTVNTISRGIDTILNNLVISDFAYLVMVLNGEHKIS
jgi:hypothetical protein